MSGIDDAIAIIEATPVEQLVQDVYIHPETNCRCVMGVLADAAGVSNATLIRNVCFCAGATPEIWHPIEKRFGLVRFDQDAIQHAFDIAPNVADAKVAALHMLREIADERKLPIS